MNANEKEYMDRYIYQVIRRLPKAQRDEVRMELEELISDMYADKGSMEAVLTQLGDPAAFAKQYQNDCQYLIGPEYYETYLWFVRVVLICTFVPVFGVSLAQALGEAFAVTSQNAASVWIRAAAKGLTDGIADALISCVCAFGAVTLIFAILERQKVKIEEKKAEKWSVGKLEQQKKTADFRWTPGFLEPVPDKKAIISRGDSAVGIVFIVIFGVLLIAAPQFFAFLFTEKEMVRTVPVFNLNQWGSILPVFVLSLLIGLADEILRLVAGCYCKPVMISSMVCGAVQIVLSAVVLKVLPIWNPNFAQEIRMAMGEEEAAVKIFSHWNPDMVSNVLLVGIILITVIEIGVTIYKTLRYGSAVKSPSKGRKIM